MDESIYGNKLQEMQSVMENMQLHIEAAREQLIKQTGLDPVEHCLARIKSEKSMREKCQRQGIPETTESALEKIHDAIGLRVVCGFLNDIYLLRNLLVAAQDFTVISEKDYIRNAKPNGYRSYHMIVQTDNGYYVELQLRTISMDTWAALEHHLKYKKTVKSNSALIEAELKRCAEELASTDVSMQTLREMIMEGEQS